MLRKHDDAIVNHCYYGDATKVTVGCCCYFSKKGKTDFLMAKLICKVCSTKLSEIII